MTNEIALYCMKAYSEYYSEVCEECPIYGETGTDHCFEDALEMAIKALEQGDALRELRQEIVGIRDCEEERPNRFGCDKLIAYERVIDLVDTKIKELSE